MAATSGHLLLAATGHHWLPLGTTCYRWLAHFRLRTRLFVSLLLRVYMLRQLRDLLAVERVYGATAISSGSTILALSGHVT
jgi:hypothetical protein